MKFVKKVFLIFLIVFKLFDYTEEHAKIWNFDKDAP